MTNDLHRPPLRGAEGLRAIIIDDERHSCDVLKMLLGKCCQQVHVTAICYSGEEGLRKINELQPQLVFLDIEMPHMNGFQLLEQLSNITFEIIFTTSYDQYAITAFKFSALDYLLKPVDREELEKAVQKVSKKINPPVSQQLEILLQKINQPTIAVQRIALPTMQGLEFVPVESIISCSSSNNYTEFFLKDKKKLLVSRTLKEVEDMLADHSFIRVHNSHIVNLNAITRYVKGEGGYLVMSDSSTIDVSRSRKEFLMQRLQPYKE
ncbi:MAG TPA: LytTR family DNA-binding domain-containing protein [Chitinophagaceae bacterium]|nr:LytTR family DNA-binding domain-containing protein [Chitinophagaceae bacterium]